MKSSEELFLKRTTAFSGAVALPGSKSIANRALLLSALCQGETILQNIPQADDIAVMLRALKILGVELESRTGFVWLKGQGRFPVREAELDLENAGTAMRPLLAVLAFSGGKYRLTGNEQMQKRPVGDLLSALDLPGVSCQARQGSFPPVAISSTGIASARLAVKGELSSQFISALLLAAPLARGLVEIEVVGQAVSQPYVDLTIDVMRSFGVDVERRGYSYFRIDAQASYKSPGTYFIEGDATAATYFLGLGALPGSGPVSIEGLPEHSIQGDSAFSEIIEAMGGLIERENGALVASGKHSFQAIDLDLNHMPDAAMTLAVLCAFSRGKSRLRNIANLELKESKRLTGLACELNRLGIRASASASALEIEGGLILHPARIETYRDHRMAMAFSLACYGTDLTILDPGCVSKTFPDYFSIFQSLIQPE